MKKIDLKTSKKIDSPLAKYNSAGQLFCVLCNQQVKNEMVWTAHVNGRAHRENIQQLKSKKRPQDTTSDASPPPKKLALEAGPSSSSAKNVPDSEFKFQVPLPVSPAPSTSLSTEFRATAPIPKTFKDKSHSPTTTISKITTPRPHIQTSNSFHASDDDDDSGARSNGMEIDVQGSDKPNANGRPSSTTNGVSLPEGFFDDPKLDAKARGLEYRDPEEIEWDNFVKEIASEEIKSSTIRVVDEEESTITRELDEIEEQMAQWQRVLDLEKKAKDLKGVKSQAPKKIFEDEEMDEEEEYDEELDWRSKRH